MSGGAARGGRVAPALLSVKKAITGGAGRGSCFQHPVPGTGGKLSSGDCLCSGEITACADVACLPVSETHLGEVKLDRVF